MCQMTVSLAGNVFYKSILIYYIRSLPQKDVEKPKVVTLRQPRAQRAKIVIF